MILRDSSINEKTSCLTIYQKSICLTIYQSETLASWSSLINWINIMQLCNDDQIHTSCQDHDDGGGGGESHGTLAAGLQQKKQQRPLWSLLPPSHSSSSSSPSSSSSSNPAAAAAASCSSVSPPAISMDLSISLPNPTSFINEKLLWGLSAGPIHPFQPLLPSSDLHICRSPDHDPISPLAPSNKGIIDINLMPSSPDSPNLGDERADGGSTARKKLRLSRDQSALLEESFKWCNTLNPKQKNALAKQLNLKPRQVEVWFQNRRARTKLKQTEMDCALLKRCCETLAEENRNLQKEVRELRERLSVIASGGGGGYNQPYNHQNQTTIVVAAANHNGSRSDSVTNCPRNQRINHLPAPDSANNPINIPTADALCSLSL